MVTKEIDARKIKSIKLPRSLRNGKVFVIENKDSLLIKKITTPDFCYVRKKLRKLKNKISQKDINEAIEKIRG